MHRDAKKIVEVRDTTYQSLYGLTTYNLQKLQISILTALKLPYDAI